MKQLLMGLLLLINAPSFAGPRIVGNGGIGIKEGNGLYMLDLYERGIHKNAFYSAGVKAPKWIEDEVSRGFSNSNMENIPMEKLIYKVGEVFNKSFLAGFTLAKALVNIDWRLLDVDLVATEDTKTPLGGLDLVQIAVRQGNVVFISLKAWNQLDEDNKVALLIHEAFYLAAPIEKTKVLDQEYGQQSAERVRSVTGLIFTKRFSAEGFTENNNLWGVFYSSTPDYYMQVGPYSFLESIDFFYPGSSYSSADINKSWTISEVENAVASATRIACSLDNFRGFYGPAIGNTIASSIEVIIRTSKFTSLLTRYKRADGETQWAMVPGLDQMTKKSKDFRLPVKNFERSCQQLMKTFTMDLLNQQANIPYK